MVVLSPVVLVSVAVLVVALGSDFWVLADARARVRRGERVSVAVGNLRVETPEAWFLGCVVLWVIFMPLYLTASGRNPFARRSL
ncbi:hypothetical protein [Actinoplanes sp. NPDC051411]|uniref:hypothetical protein n=1 Tax=Actinoplanes sp. NPDC051411 TaxID=3155522 RepID=UPI0034433219